MGAPEDRLKALNEHVSSDFAPRADIVAACRHVRFVPNSDKVRRNKRCALLDHFVGAQDEPSGYFVADRLSDLQIDHQLKSCRLLDRKLARFGAAQDLREQPFQLTKPLRNTWPVSR